MLDVTTRLSVIVGGGGVAARKAAGLIEAGAKRVRVVAPLLGADPLDSSIERIQAAYRVEHLDGAGLVFAATNDPAVNDAVVRDAQSRGILVCRANADEDSPGDFTGCAVAREGAVTIAVATAGAPALASRIRDELALHVNQQAVRMADAMQALRPHVLAVTDASVRRRVFHDLASDAALAELDSQGVEGLRRWIASRYPQLKS